MSEKPAFTPGPWHAGHLGSDLTCQCRSICDEGYAGGIATVHLDNGIKSIADGGNDCPPRDQAIGNMHLIAAAPDMFEALKEISEMFMARPDMVRAIQPLIGFAEKATFDRAAAALSKALGKDAP